MTPNQAKQNTQDIRNPACVITFRPAPPQRGRDLHGYLQGHRNRPGRISLGHAL